MSMLIVLNSAPYGTTNCKDALDVALTMAAFDQAPNILLRGEGLQLLQVNTEIDVSFKNPKKILFGLPIYDIEVIYVEQSELQKNDITDQHLASLPLRIEILTHKNLSEFYESHHHVIVF